MYHARSRPFLGSRPRGPGRGALTLGLACMVAACEPAEPPTPGGAGAAVTTAEARVSEPTLADLDEIVRFLDLARAATGEGWVDGACGRPATFEVQSMDLNEDGAPELMVAFGNTCTSGGAGISAAVFVRDEGVRLRNVLLLPGIASVRDERTLGYADLQIGGPGFCVGVWAWNGTEYDHLRNEPVTPGGCDGVG